MTAREQVAVVKRALEGGAFERLALEDEFASWPSEYEGDHTLDNQVPTKVDLDVARRAIEAATVILGERVKDSVAFTVFELVAFGNTFPEGWTELFKKRVEEALVRLP